MAQEGEAIRVRLAIEAVVIPVHRVAVGVAGKEFADEMRDVAIHIKHFVEFRPALGAVGNLRRGFELLAVLLRAVVASVLIHRRVNVGDVGFVKSAVAVAEPAFEKLFVVHLDQHVEAQVAPVQFHPRVRDAGDRDVCVGEHGIGDEVGEEGAVLAGVVQSNFCQPEKFLTRRVVIKLHDQAGLLVQRTAAAVALHAKGHVAKNICADGEIPTRVAAIVLLQRGHLTAGDGDGVGEDGGVGGEQGVAGVGFFCLGRLVRFSLRLASIRRHAAGHRQRENQH